MVRRLVQDEAVDAAHHQPRQLQAALLPAAQVGNRLPRLPVGEEEAAEDTHRRLLRHRFDGADAGHRCLSVIERVVLLCVVAEPDGRPDPDHALRRLLQAEQ